MAGRWLFVGAEGSESLPPGWEDEIVAHAIRRNKDGAITILALVNLYDDKKNCYTNEHHGGTVIKLQKR